MTLSRIAFIGPQEYEIFKLVGVEKVYTLPLNPENIKNILSELLLEEDISIIAISQRYADAVRGEIDKIKSRGEVYPIIVEISDLSLKAKPMELLDLLRKVLGVRMG